MKKIIFWLTPIIIIVATIWFIKDQTQPKNQPSNAINLLTITVGMGYIPNIQFAPFYVAQENGYFQKNGLNVIFDHGTDTDQMQLLVANQRNFIIGNGTSVIRARSNQLPVIAVADWYRQFPVCITSISTKLKTPQDLVGKKIGIPGFFGESYDGWLIFEKLTDLQNKTTLEPTNFAQVEMLTQNKIDAALCYSMNEPIQLQSLGKSPSTLLLADYTNLVSNMIITSNQFANQNPQTVRQFVDAFVKGLKDTISNPDKALEISKKFIPEISDSSLAGQKEVLRASIENWTASSDPLGKFDPKRWDLTINAMMDAGLLENQIDVKSCYTNEFIP